MVEEKKYPYTTVPNNLRKLLQKIPTLGSPPKASQKWLEGIGFTGGNNKSLLPVLRYIGVIDAAGTPTDSWTALRSGDQRKFAEVVRESYVDLFSTYPDADRQESDSLQTFFRTHTGLGEKAQSFCVRTFKVLVEFGDFTEAEGPRSGGAGVAGKGTDHIHGDGDDNSPAVQERRTQPDATPPLALTVNLQIELPASADGEVYDKLFAAMGKHLKGLVSPAE